MMEKLKVIFQILAGMAKVILDPYDDPYGYYSLIETRDGSHYPIPKIPRIFMPLVRRLKVLGVRGRNWFYVCPVCHGLNFYSLRGRSCDVCWTEFTLAGDVKSVERLQLYVVAVLPELELVFYDKTTPIPSLNKFLELEFLKELEKLDPIVQH